MKPLLIGQAPGPNTRPDKPLYPYPKTSAGARLQQMTGLERRDYLRTFDRMNLLQFFPGKIMNGDAWPISKAKIAAQAVQQLLDGRDVIFVGRNVSRAFGHDAKTLPFFQWEYNPTWHYQFACVPHPSGRNHWYNDPVNRDLALKWWRLYIEERAVVALSLVSRRSRRYSA